MCCLKLLLRGQLHAEKGAGATVDVGLSCRRMVYPNRNAAPWVGAQGFLCFLGDLHEDCSPSITTYGIHDASNPQPKTRGKKNTGQPEDMPTN